MIVDEGVIAGSVGLRRLGRHQPDVQHDAGRRVAQVFKQRGLRMNYTAIMMIALGLTFQAKAMEHKAVVAGAAAAVVKEGDGVRVTDLIVEPAGVAPTSAPAHM